MLSANLNSQAEADKSPFACVKCHKRYKRASGITKHKCGQVRHQLIMPASVRSAGGGARVGGGAE